MEKKYTLWQRITSETPAFFKHVQTCGISLAALGVTLAQGNALPEKVITIMISTGTVMTALAQFVVKQYEPDNTADYENK